MTQEMAFQSFAEAIDTAKARVFPIEAKLILRGRIDYAAERGEISLRQADQLLESIDPDFKAQTNMASEIASIGDSDYKLVPLVRERVLTGASV